MPDERLSMAEQLSAGWDKLAAEEPTHDAGQASDSARQDGEGGQASDAGQEAQRARDEAGRFAKADPVDGKAQPREKLTLKPKEARDAAKEPERAEEGKAPAAQGADPAPNRQADNGKQAADGLPAASTPIAPPAHWKGGEKVAWEKLPYPVKQALASEYGQIADLRPVAAIVEPYKQRFQQEFGGTDRALGAILETWKFARQDPPSFVRQFMQQFNIDPQTLGFGAQVQQQQPGGNAAEQQYVDPTVAGLQQRLAAIEDAARRDNEARATQQQNQISADIQAFGGEVDKATGALAHPYFNDVSRAMGALMSSGLADAPQTLKDAYDQACWAIPTIRAAMQREADRKAADARKQAVARAQRAGGSITGSPGVARAETHVKQSARADLEKNWDALEARV